MTAYNYLMQIQQNFFLLHKMILRHRYATCGCKLFFYIMTAIATYFLALLIFGHTIVLPSNHHLANCLQAHHIKFENSSFYFISDRELTKQQETLLLIQKKEMSNTSECTIIKNKDYHELDNGSLMVGWDDVGMFMNRQKRNQLRFDNYTILLHQVKPLRTVLFGFQGLVLNELLDGSLPLPQNEPIIIKPQNRAIKHNFSKLGILDKIWCLIKAYFASLLISIINSLYSYSFQIAFSTQVVIIFIKCFCFNNVVRMAPFIASHVLIRGNSSSNIIKQSGFQVLIAVYLFYYLFLVQTKMVLDVWMQQSLFESVKPSSAVPIISFFSLLNEYAAQFFMRTRPFIKYYPRIHSVLMISLLYYTQVATFGFKIIACLAVFATSFALFIFVVIKFQIPAINLRDPTDPNIPTRQRPRAAYFPLFNLAQRADLNDQWTLMMPLFGREVFSERELLYIDNNLEELQNVLRHQA